MTRAHGEASSSVLGEAPKLEVTPLELLFDLVFVFAVSQFSHYLLEHLTWRGALETLILLLAVYHSWLSASWEAAMIGVNRRQARILLLITLLLSLVANAAIPWAFKENPWAFIVPLLAGLVGRALWMTFRAPTALYREHFQRTSIWLIGVSLLWVYGATQPEAQRLWIWLLTVIVDFTAGWFAHPLPGRKLQTENVPFDVEHILERNRLFLLIALGETIMTTGAAITEHPFNWMTLATGGLALAGTVAVWALLFGPVHRLTMQRTEQTNDPMAAGRLSTNFQVSIVAGLIMMAVGNELVIAHPHGQPALAITLLLFGGPALIRLTLTGYLWFVSRPVAQSHLRACAVLMVGGLMTLQAPPFVSLILVSTLLVASVLPELIE